MNSLTPSILRERKKSLLDQIAAIDLLTEAMESGAIKRETSNGAPPKFRRRRRRTRTQGLTPDLISQIFHGPEGLRARDVANRARRLGYHTSNYWAALNRAVELGHLVDSGKGLGRTFYASSGRKV